MSEHTPEEWRDYWDAEPPRFEEGLKPREVEAFLDEVYHIDRDRPLSPVEQAAVDERWKKLDQLHHDIANPPDFSAEPLEALAKETRIDTEAARLRDNGEDYETYLKIASMRPSNDNEKGIDR